MASCPACGGKTIDEHGETVCLACGRVQDTERRPEVFPDGARNLLGETRLGSYLGSIADGQNHAQLYGGGSTVSFLKSVSDFNGQDFTLDTLESLTLRVGEKLRLSHATRTEAVLVARQTYTRARRLRIPTPVLSVHALATACRRAGRFDIGLKAIIEAHTVLGRRVKDRHLNRLCIEFPLPPADKEAILTAGIRKLFGQTCDPRLIGSILTESKALLSAFDSQGRNPMTLASVALYAACKQAGFKLTQRRSAELFGVAEFTCREIYSDFVNTQNAGNLRIP